MQIGVLAVQQTRARGLPSSDSTDCLQTSGGSDAAGIVIPDLPWDAFKQSGVSLDYSCTSSTRHWRLQVLDERASAAFMQVASSAVEATFRDAATVSKLGSKVGRQYEHDSSNDSDSSDDNETLADIIARGKKQGR